MPKPTEEFFKKVDEGYRIWVEFSKPRKILGDEK
jgi:hypothetical protein